MKSVPGKRSKRTIFFLTAVTLLLVLRWLPGESAAAEKDQSINGESALKESIVKVYTVYNKPDYFNPWRMFGAHRINGSGCIISGNRILTNAHVVADHTFIQVRRYGQAERYRAKLLSVSHDADLALLTVEDKAFFEGVTPLGLGELPETQKEVLVYGFPLGGDSLSITKGVLSRVEHHFYVHSSYLLLAGQIDAAINPGNSGGPVLVGGKVIGVVMQSIKSSKSENLGYMVPVNVVNHFFKDIGDGQYDGFPDLGIVVQKIENPDMKHMYGLDDRRTGVLVNHVLPGSPAEGQVHRGDILLSIDAYPIADDGTVEFRPKERTRFRYYADVRQTGESVDLQVFREGDVKHITLSLNRTRKEYMLVPNEQYERSPRYFIYGGIVFMPLTKNIIKQFGSSWMHKAPPRLVQELSNWVTDERKEIVVALKVLAADVNQGYHDLFAMIVEEVNEKKVKDFDEFFRIVTQSKEPYTVFRDKKRFEIVIDRKKAEESHEKILQTYRIKQDCSSDLK